MSMTQPQGDFVEAQKRCLDLFCGMGGWSIGFYREGYHCVGVDIVDVGYPYHLIQRDVHDYHPTFRPRALVMSPPCTEFSTLTKLSHAKGQRGPPDPEGPRGMGLVREAIRIRNEARAEFWVLENVWGSRPFIEPILGAPMLLAKPWVLWGNLPALMFEYEPKRGGDLKLSHTFEATKGIKHGSISPPRMYNKGGDRIGLPEDFPFDPLRSWKRARIPVWLAQSIARWIDRAQEIPA
jgi:hypothetical protein